MRRATALLLAACLMPPATAAELGPFDTDGWYTWRVEAIDEAPAACCIHWRGGDPVPRICRLDDGRTTYGIGGDWYPVDASVQIYARIKSGKPTRLRALNPACRVEVDSALTDLGAIDVEASLAWLRRAVGADSRVSEDALAAIAMHRGEAALRVLIDTANGGADTDVRKDAIFWLGQVRIGEASADIERLMFADASADIRQYAAFAMAQSESPRRSEALIRQGRKDADAEVRSQAWFWLAQTGASEAEGAITQAIADDPDAEVREEAVFALSELPEERAVDALVAVLGDRRLSRELREQALFWLAQSESDRAFAVVERLLVGDP